MAQTIRPAVDLANIDSDLIPNEDQDFASGYRAQIYITKPLALGTLSLVLEINGGAPVTIAVSSGPGSPFPALVNLLIEAFRLQGISGLVTAGYATGLAGDVATVYTLTSGGSIKVVSSVVSWGGVFSDVDLTAPVLDGDIVSGLADVANGHRIGWYETHTFAELPFYVYAAGTLVDFDLEIDGSGPYRIQFTSTAAYWWDQINAAIVALGINDRVVFLFDPFPNVSRFCRLLPGGT